MTKHEQLRPVNWRQKILDESGVHSHGVSKTCRRYSISCQTVYKWKKHYEAQGEMGLRDKSHAPHY